MPLWMNLRLKQICLPAAQCGALIALVVSAPITATSLILNGLAITFASGFDNILAAATLYLTDSQDVLVQLEDEIETVYETVDDWDELLAIVKSGSLFSALWVTLLGIGSLFGIMLTEELMPAADAIFDLLGNVNEAVDRACSNIYDVVKLVCVILSLLGATLEPTIGRSVKPSFFNSVILEIVVVAIVVFLSAFAVGSFVTWMQQFSSMHS